jgi:hypothetical protein
LFAFKMNLNVYFEADHDKLLRDILTDSIFNRKDNYYLSSHSLRLNRGILRSHSVHFSSSRFLLQNDVASKFDFYRVFTR